MLVHTRHWNRTGVALLGGTLVFTFSSIARLSPSLADEQPTTQKAEEPKQDKPVDPIEAAKAAARASTQPATKPASPNGAANQPKPAVTPVPNPSRTPPRAQRPGRPTVPHANLNQPPTNPPANGANPAQPGGRPGRPGAAQVNDPRNPRNSRLNPPGRPGVTPPPATTPPAGDASAQPAGEGDSATPVITNTETKMLVFQIEDPKPDARTYRFQYVDTPWPDVLEDFSRVSGLPLVNKPDPTAFVGNLTYFSNDEYTFEEALHKLNELLFMNPLNNHVLQRKPKYLTIDRLPDLVRKIGPERMYNTFEEFEAANLDPYEVCLTKYQTPENWSAFQVIEHFRSLFSDTYGTEIIGENLIQLTGLAREHLQFKHVVGLLTKEKPPTELDKPYVEIRLKSQKVATVQTILNQLYQIMPSAPRARPGVPATIDQSMQQAQSLTITPDITNNVLYIRGPRYIVEDIKATVARIDKEGGEWKAPKREIVKLTNAAANSIVTTLKPIFQKMQMDINKSQLFIPEEVKASLDVDIFPDVASNAIIIVGGEEGLAQAKAMVQQYDIPPEWVTEIVPLQHIKSDEAAQAVQMLLQRLMQSKGGVTMMPQATPHNSSSLLVSCSPTDLREVKALLEKIDTPDAEEPHEHILTLEYATPSEVAQTVTQVLTGKSGGQAAPRMIQVQPTRGKPGQPIQPVRPMPQAVMPGGAAGGGKSPLLIPDDDAKILMVYCSDMDWPQIEDLVKKLDATAGTVKPMLHTIELKKANPEDVAAMINNMFPAAPGSGTPQIVTADIYNNAVRIFARPDFVEQVVPLIETLDINATAELTVIKLEHCKADVIAPILAQGIPGAQAITTARANVPTPNMPQQQRPQIRPGMPGGQVTQLGDTSVRIVAEPITNSLLVTAPPKELEQIQKLVGEMEKIQQEQYGGIGQVIVAVENRPADEIATTLTTLLGSGPAVQRVPGVQTPVASGNINPAAEELKIVANGDRIILKGPEVKIAEALLIIERIDVANQAPEARIYAVKNAEIDEQKLRTLLAGRAAGAGARPTPSRQVPGRPVQQGQNIQQISIPTQATADIQIFADVDENTLLIRALPKDFVEIEELLKVVLSDAPLKTITGEDREASDQFFMVRLKHKSAWDMEFILDDFVNRDDRSKIEFLEGPTTKDLIVMNYKPGQEERIREYIEMFDVSDSPGTGKFRVYDLESKLTAAQVEMFFQMNGGTTKSGKPIKFVRSGDSSRVQVIDIHAEEEAEAPPAAKPGTENNSGETTRPDPNASSSAWPARGRFWSFPFSLVQDMAAMTIAQTAPTGDESQPPSSRALEFRGVENVTPPAGTRYDHIQIIEDPETGRLLLVGPEEEIEEIIEILDELKDEESPTVVRVFPLKRADVTTAAQLLNQVFNQQAAPQAPQQRGRAQQPNQQQGGQQQIDPRTGQPVPQQQQQQQPPPMPQPGGRGGAAGGAVLKVVPDERTKSLFVVARQADIPIIIEVLRRIDESVVNEKTLRFFKLEKLQAEDVVENLKEILGIESATPARGRGRPGQPGQQQQQGGEQQIVNIPGAQGGATVSAEKIKLSAETQTNTVIAQAPEDTLELIAGLIAELEKLTVGTAWEMKRFELKHARATDIADIVDDLARELLPGGGAAGQGGQQQQQFQGGRGPRRAGVNRVLVEADARTNSVIVAGQAKDFAVVENIIKDLDVEESENNVRQFTVKALPTELVPTLKDLFVAGRDRGEDADTIITGNDATKTILVKAPAPMMAQIAEQIEAMDAKVEEDKKLRSIKLAVANAETVATKLTEVFAQQGSRGRQGEVTIKGVKSSGMVYVRCPDDMFESIKTVALSMDAAPTDVMVTRIGLKNAVAQDVHQRVQQLMSQAIAGPGGQMNLDFVGLTPDPRTNSLVLVGGPTSAMLLKSLVAEVDVAPETPMVRSTAAYTLPAGTDVNQVLNNINQMFVGVSIPTTGVEAPRVTANTAANLVIVEANAEQQTKIKTSIIDPILNAVSPRKDYVYQVVNAQATQLANTVMTQVRSVMPAVNGKYPVNITGDDGANTLLINASPNDYETAMAMITPLDVPPQDRVTRAFRVNYVAPWTMANLINQQYGTPARNPNERVTAGYEDGTMSIIVTANAKNMDQVAKLIAETDVQGKAKETRFIKVKQARADDLQRALDASLRGRMPVQRSGQYPFNITADPSSNVLVVTAESALFPDIEELVNQLDIPPLGADDMVRKTFKMTYADPWAVAANIRTGFQAVNRNPSPRDIVTATENPTTNSVFVTASTSNMSKIEALIADMDQADSSGVRKEHVIEVLNANPNDVATSLQQIFAEAYRMRRQQTPPTIRAMAGTTKIVVYANEEEFKQIKSLVEKVDIEGGRVVHSVTMPEQIPARGVADNINQLFGSRGGAAGDGPKAQYHEPTNTILVSATDAEFEKINKQLIEPLGKSEGSKVRNFYKIALKYAVADEVATTLQEFFDKKAGVAQNRNLPPWMRSQSTSEAQDNQVTVMAETGSNTLLIFCTETTKKLIDELLADIDVDRETGKIVQMVALQYQDAKEMLEVMTEVLRVQKRADSGKQDEFVPWWFDGRREEQEEEVVLAGGMRLKAIESSNSLIVSGKEDLVNDAVTKIKELDVPGDSGHLTPVEYVVQNGRAGDMAETLKKTFIEGQQQTARANTGPKLTIVADEASNKLFVRGKVSEVSAVIETAKSMDSAIETEGTGIQLVQVPPGQNVTSLADMLTTQVNNRERDKSQRIQGYKADLVTITPDTRSNTLLVSASKANMEEIKKTVESLVAMGPLGNRQTRILKIDNLTTQQIRDLINQAQQNQTGGQGGNRGGRGPRGDAGWTNSRRYDRLLDSGAPAKSKARKTSTVAATMPILMMQLALGTAIAQTPPPRPQESKGPKISTIRPRVATTQPALAQTRQPAAQPNQPRVTRGLTLTDTIQSSTQPAAPANTPRQAAAGTRTVNDLVASTTQPANFSNWSPAAKDAFQLTGAEVTVTEAGPGMIVLDGLESDLNTLEGLIRLLEQSVPDKRVEYRRLKNANATDLAQTLTQVFAKIEVSGSAPALPQDKVDIIPDTRTNGIYVAASEKKMEQALRLIDQADTEIDMDKLSRAFVFKNRRVTEAGEILKKLSESYLKQRGLTPSLISIELDPQTNTVFVTAGENDLEIVTGFVETLDAAPLDEDDPKSQAAAHGRADIMVVPLRVAKADTLATLLNTLLTKAATGDTPMKDFIRRLRLLDENGNPLATVDLNKPIVVAGDPDSNSLMIASTVENCLIMKQVALAFDKEPSKSPVLSKIYTLEYADAEEVATRLNEVVTESENLTQRPGLGDAKGVPEGEAGNLVYKAVIKADPRTNQVVVVGRPDAVEVFDRLIKELDVKGRGIMPFEIVKLEFANPSALAAALTEMLDKRKETIAGAPESVTKTETVIITPDARSQTLIIAAKRDRMEELKGLIKQLDVKASALVENIRTITLKKSTATELADKLKDLWTQTRDQREGGDTGTLGLEIPAIVADERSNSLIVSASLSDFESIKGVVEKIENLELNPMANIYIVPMKFNSASQLQGPLQSLFDARSEMRGLDEPRPEDKVSIEVDEATNSLLVAASRENIEVLMEKVKELDVEVGVMGQIEFFKGENVSAHRLKEVIDELFTERIYKPGASATGEGAEDRERVSTVVDDRSNVLIVTASPENMAVVREIYKRMNSLTEPWNANFITNVIQLQHGDSVQVAAQVEEYFDRLEEVNEGGEGGGSPLYSVRIFADEKRNRVIVGGTRDGIERAKALIQQLDMPPGDSNQIIKVYTLQEAPADKVKEMITNIFQERNQPRGEGGGTVPDITVTVESNGGARMLVINASRLDHALIENLIKELDRPSALLDMVKVFPLARARAEKIKEIIDEVYQSAQTGGDTGGQTVAVVADERTNSVVIAAPPGELKNVETIIARLDRENLDNLVEVAVIPCENEDAEEMANILNQIMMGEGGEGGGSTENENLPPATVRPIQFSAEERVLQTMRENVQITFNARSNSVVAVAPPETLRLIKELVRKLDGIQKKEVLVKVFLLRHADATKTVEILEKMFAQDEASGDQSEFQEGREMNVEGGISGTGGVPTAESQSGDSRRGTFGRPKTTFVPDERTNAIITAGWPEDIDVVADILDQLDSREIQDRESFIYTAVNMKAVDMQTALDSHFQAEKGVLDGAAETVSPQQKMEREVSVIAHEESNQLIVSTSPRKKADVLSIIEQLDSPPPQVMIQVMIAEVTIDDRFEMGLEFALQELRFSETAVPGGNGVLQSSHFDVVGGTDLGAAGSGLGGFSFTITGEDFNFLVRALQSDSRLEVIQRPMVMCQDNQVANITIGQSVPIPQASGQTTGGTVQTSVTYQDVGVILDVEPNINPDGWVYLKVAPEVSDIADSSIQVSPGVFAPIFTNRKADTFVAVKDGETVVIGGLITTSDLESESKVPGLGDIPGLGALFRTTTRTKRKTELLIALTPRIVRTVEDGYRLSIEERDKSGIITDEMKASPYFEKIRLTPESEDEISSIEEIPEGEYYEPAPGDAPVEPTRHKTTPNNAPKYGPQVPQYGPMVPSEPSPDDEDVVARRPSKSAAMGTR